MKIWLDDNRLPPDNTWMWICTYQWAISRIQTCVNREEGLEALSFDHDLGDPDPKHTGYGVACFIEELAAEGLTPRFEWDIHSENPVGRANIERAMASVERFWMESERKIEMSLMSDEALQRDMEERGRAYRAADQADYENRTEAERKIEITDQDLTELACAYYEEACKNEMCEVFSRCDGDHLGMLRRSDEDGHMGGSLVTKETAQYIVLEGVTASNEGQRFYTSNDPQMDQTRGETGGVWYRVVGYANTDDEARDIISHGK